MNTRPPAPGRFRRVTPVLAGLAMLLVPAASALAREGLGDRVFHDRNNNGVMDPGEQGVAGVVVTAEVDQIVNATGARGQDCLGDGNPAYPKRATTTNGAGGYHFPAIGQGTFVVELAPENFVPGGALHGFTSSTGGPLTRGPYEPGIPESGLTSDDGRDHGTVAGDRIRACGVDLRIGAEPLGESATPGIVVVDPDSSQQMTIDFGVFRPGPAGPAQPQGPAAVPNWTLGDRVWNDVDRDGIQDRGEPGIGEVEVLILDPAGLVLGRTRTDRAGRYRFDGFLDGVFRLRFRDLPAGAVPTRRSRAAAPDRNSDIDRAGTTPPVRMAGGTTDTTLDAGFVVPAALGGIVWRDRDRDGRRDAREPVIRGAGVALVEVRSGRRIRLTRTGRDGRFIFGALPPGRYRVAPLPRPGWSFTRPNRGPDSTDSDVLPRTGATPPIVVRRAQQILTVGIGVVG